MGVSIPFNKSATAHNSVFAVRFAHPNAFCTSQTRKTLSDIRSINNGDNQVDAIKEGLKWENIK
jgi:hypothetical protein